MCVYIYTHVCTYTHTHTCMNWALGFTLSFRDILGKEKNICVYKCCLRKVDCLRSCVSTEVIHDFRRHFRKKVYKSKKPCPRWWCGSKPPPP